MKYRSVFDIIGPIMVGPSSSHTAGAARIGKWARTVLGEEPTYAYFHLYGSFKDTYRGHGTDVALVSGVLNFDPEDERMLQSLKIAQEKNIDIKFIEEKATPNHPNTVKVVIGNNQKEFCVVGQSIGGGKIEIVEVNSFAFHLTGDHPALFIFHQDIPGLVAQVALVLAQDDFNIGHMEVSRKEKGKEALMLIETDQRIPNSVIEKILNIEHVASVICAAE
ncbi:MAG: L-serine ammonia-lyase, iron-sulfur-dependent subunit beta [Bacilli bacterium]